MKTSRLKTHRSLTLALLVAATLPAAAAAGAPAAGEAPAEARRVVVTAITVTGNTLLPPSAIDAALARYKGERTLDELKEAARSLQAMYRQAGYGAVVAYLPEQPLAGGTLLLAVLEGRVARVGVLGNQRFSAANVRRALPALVEGQTPPVQQIDAQVQLANDNPARKIALTLEAGAAPGEVDVSINVSEQAASRTTVSVDNTGSPQTGRVRVGLAWQHAALFDADHQFAVQAQFAPEHPSAVRIFSASYKLPLYAAGLMLGAYASYSNVDAGSTPTAAGALQFNGSGRVFGLSAMRLLANAGEFEQRVTASFDAREYLNNCAIQGLPEGACGSAGESVSVYPLTLEYLAQRGGERPLALSLGASHNLGLGGRYGRTANFEAVRPGASRSYTVARVNGFAGLPFASGWRVSGRISAQAGSGALVPGEQFGLSGAAAVRGYEEREVIGDRGYFGSFELLSPTLVDSAVRVLAFADAGQVRNALGTLCNATDARCSLAAAGLGLRFAQGPVQVKLDIAHALRAGRSTEARSTRVHLQASVFLP